MKIIFLYTELAPYFLSCMDALVLNTSADIHIVRKTVNKEAPFEFSFPGKIKVYERNTFNKNDILAFVKAISPDLIYCSGWKDNEYLSVCKIYKNKIPVIVGFDNKWTGSLKQRVGAFLKPVTIRKYFSHCWIPGIPQLEFAKKLGFASENILTGFYSCDYNYFHNLFLQYKESKKNRFPHRLIFVGRYYDFKGIKNLWSAFIAIQNESPNNWELWCLGTGDMEPVIHPSIKHFGFIQPKDIGKFIADTGVFVLPSLFEPWGVAVHEFASAGFPLICSSEVGSSTLFLKENENGFAFRAGDINSLKTALSLIFSLNDDELFSMGEKSSILAKQITPETWTHTLMSVVNG